MPKKGAVQGTKDQCRHCNLPLIFDKAEIDDRTYSWQNALGWRHIDTLSRKCAQTEEHETLSHVPNAEPFNFCTVMTNQGTWSSGEICNRQVTEPDVFACGIHAKKLIEAVKREEDYRVSWELNRWVADETKKVVLELKERWGIEAKSGYGGDITLNPGPLLEVLDKLTKEYEDG